MVSPSLFQTTCHDSGHRGDSLTNKPAKLDDWVYPFYYPPEARNMKYYRLEYSGKNTSWTIIRVHKKNSQI